MARLLSVNVGLPRDVRAFWVATILLSATVAEVDALLYLPGHSNAELERALRIPALSRGWRSSFQAMLQQDLNSCMTDLIDGSIVYNPEPMERPAAGNVLVCCSQPTAAITLDL